MKKLVMDIQRCSIHDGPGIRTTIFIKGCPLKCRWCHNPESQSYKQQISFNKMKCINCFRCMEVCPNQAHFIEDNKHHIDFDKCHLCGKCIDACNMKALSIIGKEMSVKEIIDVIIKDKEFYKNSGGGITISGGEPLSNIDFTLDILKECKKLNIHTCIETSGFAPSRNISKIIDYVDMFLFDFKLSQENEHIEYTGVSNDKIMRNLDYIYSKGKSIILRCPIIPTVNDNKKHLAEIKKIALKYVDIHKIELMPYHDFGISKSSNIGCSSYRYPTPTEEEKKQWIKYFKENNISKVI